MTDNCDGINVLGLTDMEVPALAESQTRPVSGLTLQKVPDNEQCATPTTPAHYGGGLVPSTKLCSEFSILIRSVLPGSSMHVSAAL